MTLLALAAFGLGVVGTVLRELDDRVRAQAIRVSALEQNRRGEVGR